MKAYKATDDISGGSTVVFAETRGKAKSALLMTDTFDGYNFMDIKPYRCKELDDQYRGHVEMNWFDDNDRLALIKYGWSCLEFDPIECRSCLGKEYCDRYQDYIDEVI